LALPDSTSVAIAPIEGTPRATAEKLGPAMASALQEREIAASDKTASIGSYELVGRIQEMPPSQGKAALVVLWELRDPSGRRLGERADRLDAPAADWDAGNEDAVARLGTFRHGISVRPVVRKRNKKEQPKDPGRKIRDTIRNSRAELRVGMRGCVLCPHI